MTKDSVSRDLSREHQQTRTSSGSNSDKVMNNYPVNYDKQRIHVDPNKVPPKHEQVRRHDEMYLKNENEIKKHLSASVRDKNFSGTSSSSNYMNRNIPSQQQQLQQQQQPKLKPFVTDPSKSVLKPNTMIKQEIKQESSSYSVSTYHQPVTELKQEVPPQPLVKKPSLFSPEKSPPQKKLSFPVKTEVNPSTSASSSGISSMSSISPHTESHQRFRTISGGSEPELRPVVQKIDQQQGFEMLMRDPSVGIKLHQVPDIIMPIVDIKDEKLDSSYSKDMKSSDGIPPFSSVPLVNGIETNPTLISNLLKEAPSVPHLSTVTATTQPSEIKEKDKAHTHKEHKKKNKEKHKHKDKDKSKEDKEKKKKHKDKDREKHKHRDKEKHLELDVQEQQPVVAEPIKLTIQKDRIQPVENLNPAGSLKIKIPKDKIKTEAARTELKIKIPKEVIGHFDYSGETSSSGKKRERDRNSPNGAGVPPTKISRSSLKQNGRHSHGKVSSYNSTLASRQPQQQQQQQKQQQQQQKQQQQYNALPPPAYPVQPTGYYYYPGVQVPPPNVIPHSMNVPPPPYMYQQFYGQGYMYPTHTQEMYTHHPPPANTNVPPPLPADAPPDVPPPPPPE